MMDGNDHVVKGERFGSIVLCSFFVACVWEVVLVGEKNVRKWPPVWSEILLFFLDNWGQHVRALGVVEPLAEEEFFSFHRFLELEGNTLFVFDVDRFVAADLCGWLAWTVPQIWGAGEDIGRIAMVLNCPKGLLFSPDALESAQLAMRFPFPILFRIDPGVDQERWLAQHPFLVGGPARLVFAS